MRIDILGKRPLIDTPSRTEMQAAREELASPTLLSSLANEETYALTLTRIERMSLEDKLLMQEQYGKVTSQLQQLCGKRLLPNKCLEYGTVLGSVYIASFLAYRSSTTLSAYQFMVLSGPILKAATLNLLGMLGTRIKTKDNAVYVQRLEQIQDFLAKSIEEERRKLPATNGR